MSKTAQSRRVVVAAPPYRIYKEIRVMLDQGFRALGWTPTIADAPAPELLDTDLFLLVGNGPVLEDYARLLEDAADARPTTALWQFDPLPPPQMSEAQLRKFEAEDRVLRTVDEHKFLRTVKGMVSPKIKLRLRRAMYAVLNPRGHTHGNGHSHGNGDSKGDEKPRSHEDIDRKSWILMTGRYAWIRHHFDSGTIEHVFTPTVSMKSFLVGRGIPCECVPMGYHPALGRPDPDSERDIDVIFIGHGDRPRQKEILDAVQTRLQLRGQSLHIANKDCFGDNRTALLNRARISLNLAKYPWSLSGERFLMSMGCGAVVVSETIDNTSPYVPGEHFIQADPEDLPGAVARCLNNEDERSAMARRAYDFVTNELTLEKSLERIVNKAAPRKKGASP